MNNEEVAQKLVDQITEVEDYLDNLFYWLQHCTEIDNKEYREGMNKVKQLLQELQVFDPSDNQPKHPKITLSDSKGTVLGTSESTKGTKKDAEYPSITLYNGEGDTIGRCDSITILYDGEGDTMGRCDSITGDAISGVYNILYLHGVDFHKGKNIDDLKKVEVTLSSTESEEYLVLTSTKLPGSENSFRCTTLPLNRGVAYKQ